MNRLFLVIYCLMLSISLIRFLLRQKGMPTKQRWVMYTLYALTFVFLFALQFQYHQMLPTGHLLNLLTPRVKLWVDQWL
jgi:hypothetical protein